MAGRGRCSPTFYHNDPSLAYGIDDPKGWKCCWGGWMCFSPRRQEKYQRAETYSETGEVSLQSPVEDGSLASDFLNQVAILPPVMGAPPPSPVSFGGNVQSTSSHVSPVTLLKLFPQSSEKLNSQRALRFDAGSTDEHAGLFMLDNTLVTPPIYSTLTTASATPLSTAPFTPPPELAHLTTPSSPEVPFAQVLEPPLGLQGSLLDKVHEHLSLQCSLPSNHQPLHQPDPCSSIGQFMTSNLGASRPEILSPAPKMDKGSTEAEVLKNNSVSAFGSASLEGFGAITSETTHDKPVIMEHVLQQKAEGTGLLGKDGTFSPTIIHDSSEYKYSHRRQNSEECCSRCGELSARCKDLSEALEQTKRKLTLVERRVNSIDERENKFKQLMQWMQLGAKLQQENNFQLSKESPRQAAMFSDAMKECHLAESGCHIAHTEGNNT